MERTIGHYLNDYQDQVQEAIDEIMDNFDFERVHKVMDFLNWKWFSADANSEVPDPSELRKSARKQIKECLQGSVDYSDYFSISCGGFEVVVRLMDRDVQEPDDFIHNVCITLRFVLDSWDTIL